MIEFISIEHIKNGMVAGADIFAVNEIVPIVRENTVLTSRMIEVFRLQGLSVVPVLVEAKKAETIANQPDIKPMLDEKLRVEAVSGIQNMFTAVSKGEESMTTAYQAVKELDTIVSQLVDTLTTESKALVHIADLKSYDEYTFHHSLSVSVLSIAIGQQMSLSNDDLRILGRAAIMHDIGKMLVPVELINKPSRLSNEEFLIVKQHPERGYDYLVKGNIGDDAMRMATRHHHEKMDGSGYPDRLKEDELKLISRIVSVADVYDAVTSYRPYRTPMPPSQAIELVMSEVGTSFDYDIVKAFVEKLELYPINTCVELSDKRCGIVVDNSCSMRPILRMLDNGEMIDLMDIKNLSLIITRVFNKHHVEG